MGVAVVVSVMGTKGAESICKGGAWKSYELKELYLRTGACCGTG